MYRAPYPRPQELGGHLIRKVIAFLKSQRVELPIRQPILLAVSGGADSIALAHLLVHFGRRIVDRENLSLLQIDHQWRPEISADEQEFVKNLGESWGVSVICEVLPRPMASASDSLENLARRARKKIYEKYAGRGGSFSAVLTAHHADDLAETVLWRLFTGAIESHGEGIRFSTGVEMRPLLNVRKAELIAYLNEVGQVWCEDQSNQDLRFLRARMRQKLMPEIELLFPKAVEHLVDGALRWRKTERKEVSGLGAALQSEIVKEKTLGELNRLKRVHLQKIDELANTPESDRSLQLPGGWILTRSVDQRWILEKKVPPRIQRSE